MIGLLNSDPVSIAEQALAGGYTELLPYFYTLRPTEGFFTIFSYFDSKKNF
jgi:hypothetical protein